MNILDRNYNVELILVCKGYYSHTDHNNIDDALSSIMLYWKLSRKKPKTMKMATVLFRAAQAYYSPEFLSIQLKVELRNHRGTKMTNSLLLSLYSILADIPNTEPDIQSYSWVMADKRFKLTEDFWDLERRMRKSE